jgi:serine protease AprX
MRKNLFRPTASLLFRKAVFFMLRHSLPGGEDYLPRTCFENIAIFMCYTIGMKKLSLFVSLTLFLVVLTGAEAPAGIINPQLQSTLRSLGPQSEISVIVLLTEKADLTPFRDKPKFLRRTGIVKALKDKADLTQKPLRAFLEGHRARRIKSLWLINGMAVTATADVIREMAALPEVKEIRLDKTVQVPTVTYAALTVPEWNMTAIRAPEVWNNGFTGTGVVVANMDTGVDINHPDLQNKWRGGANSWFNPYSDPANAANCGVPDNCSSCELSSGIPCDVEGHGTQTMGIMVGGGAGGTTIGVAPDAKWIAVKMFNDAGKASYSTIHQGFQWLLDPDQNPATDDAPDVVNNSWGLSNINYCSLEFEPDIQTLKAAGIAVVFAGGNSGPNLSTSISPANNPDSFAVGAVDQSQTVASFSSRGPSACDGAIYPDLAAPGVNVRTSDITFGGTFPNSYAIVSGTSCSAPHVAGAMALLLSAFPNLTVSEIELALRQSSFDLGLQGADYDYGYGLLDVMKTYQALINPAPEISVFPASNQFGTVKEGSFSSLQTFTVTNKGIRDLLIGSVSITGQNANEFPVESNGCSSQALAPDGDCAIQIAFSPTSGGAKGADLSIASNDPRQNPFLVPLSGTGIEQYSLTIVKRGSGSGKVTTTVAGIDCGADCSELYPQGTVVTLKALPDAESAFGGWSGCTSSFGRTCRVKMAADKAVTATFEGPIFTLTSPNGGEVWTAGIRKKITWSYTGNPGLYVRLELLKGGSLYATIANQVRAGFRGKGARYWSIPKEFPPGNDYEIRVTSTSNNSYTDTSDSPFTISP